MRELWGADKLQAQLESAKDDLRGLEKNIRKILGRDVPEGENGNLQAPQRIPTKRPLQDDRPKRQMGIINNGPGGKRRWSGGIHQEPKTVFSRLSARIPSNADDSGDEDDSNFKPAVFSRVTVTPREVPSRQDVLRREKVDERSRQRNKRMFGALLGTLQKFCQEETKLKEKEEKKAQVEAKVDEASRREKEQMRRERQQLFSSRKQQLARVKALEIKLDRSRQFQEWRNSQLPLLNFIRTKTKPHIYYLPKRSTPKSDSLLEESAKTLKNEIDEKEGQLLGEFDNIESAVGAVKNTAQVYNSEDKDEDHRSIEEGEENRDPNDNNGDVSMISLPQSPPNHEKEEKEDNIHNELETDHGVLEQSGDEEEGEIRD